MNGEQANQTATKLTMEQADAPKYSRIEVQCIDPNGDPAKGFRVMGRGMEDHSRFTELAR